MLKTECLITLTKTYQFAVIQYGKYIEFSCGSYLDFLFCTFLNTNKLSFWLGSARGCKRYHVDMVPFRLLVTYEGQGTEILPNYAANRNAFVEGKPNNKIVKDKSARKFINKWDIAIFKGGKNGILHRTPDSALKCHSSILMRLDDPSFLDEIKKVNKVAEPIYLQPLLETQIK